MSWILVFGAVVCGWAMLRTMGGERERRLTEKRAAAQPPPPPAPTPPANPQPNVRRATAEAKSKWARQAA